MIQGQWICNYICTSTKYGCKLGCCSNGCVITLLNVSEVDKVEIRKPYMVSSLLLSINSPDFALIFHFFS